MANSPGDWLCFACTVVGAAWIVWLALDRIRRGQASTYDLCDECGYDMQATPDRCPECGWIPPLARPLRPGRVDVQKLIDSAPADAITLRQPGEHEQRVVVYESDHTPDADVLCEHLEARGVPCVVVSRESSMQRGAMLRRDTYCQVVVWSDDVEIASALVASATRGDVEGDAA